MRLSAPIYRLKRQARQLSRENAIALNQALDQVATREGFRSWSHLSATHATTSPARSILSALSPGELMILAARPGHGKTVLGLEIAEQAQRVGYSSFFFTLDYTAEDVAQHIPDPTSISVDTSDDISAAYILERLSTAQSPPVVVIDYLQLLDQKRTNPPVEDQVKTLKTFTSKQQAIIILISQIDRAFELEEKAMPDISDVRLPNPLDLRLFDKTCFLHDGKIRLETVR
ncbi:MAG: DNA helicase [Pseudomonadota bacterium]